MNNSIPAIIVDSSGLISLLIDTDSNHNKALKALNSYEFATSTIAIPNDVFSECLNVLGKKLGHKLAVEGGEKMIKSPVFQIVDTNDPLRRLALEKFKDQPDSVSFTDCIVMALADIWETKQIFGFDEVFKKSGYQIPI